MKFVALTVTLGISCALAGQISYRYGSMVSVSDQGAGGDWQAPGERIWFGDGFQQMMDVQYLGKSDTCRAVYQDVLFTLDSLSGKRNGRTMVNGYRGCAFELEKDFSVLHTLEARNPIVIDVDSVDNNILFVADSSELPFVNTGSQIIPFGAEFPRNTEIHFLKSGITFNAGDFLYSVTKKGAKIRFTKEGVKLQGLKKTTAPKAPSDDGGGGIGDMLGGLLAKPPQNKDANKSRIVELGATAGTRSVAEIMATIRTSTPGLRRIYDSTLQSHPGTKGRINLKFTISPAGEIIAIEIVNSTTNLPEFDANIKQAVALWQFVPHAEVGNVTVTVPFTFE